MVYQNKSYNFILRLLSTIVLVPLILFIVQLSGFYFTSMVLAAAIIMGGEWFYISHNKQTIWKISGVIYILLSCLSLLWISDQHHLVNEAVKFNGTNTIISIFIIVWANDIGGYVFGKIIGGKKICPSISPNKTWSGFFGGIFFAIIVSQFVSEGIGSAGIAAIIASIGDFLESWAKRQCKVKDSGNLIPGHGGLLDRVDGIMLLSIVIAAIGICFK